MTTHTHTPEAAMLAAREAADAEARAVYAYAAAYDSAPLVVEDNGTVCLYATADGWLAGPLPFACEVDVEGEVVLLWRDGGPCTRRFTLSELVTATDAGATEAAGLVAFARTLELEDVYEAAGLLLVVLGEEGGAL